MNMSFQRYYLHYSAYEPYLWALIPETVQNIGQTVSLLHMLYME